MNLTAIAFGCCLLGQIPQGPSRYEPRVEPKAAPAAPIEEESPDTDPATSPADAPSTTRQFDAPDGAHAPAGPPHTQDQPDHSTTPMADVPRQKMRPPDILAHALTPPDEAPLAGKPVSLLAAMSRTTDRQQQLRIARAYWGLATAQADYYWALDHRDKLKQYTHQHTAVPEVQSAMASARALTCEAELGVGQAQQELADLIGASADGLPLTTDRPHVGGYNMYYEEIFAQRAPPPRIRLIHRMLPIRRQAIDAHGDAILAAADALEATGDEFQRTGQGLGAVLATAEQLQRERRLFVAAVRQYNCDIAEYLLNVAPLGTNEQTLVSKMILVNGQRTPEPAPSGGGNRTFAPPDDATSARPNISPGVPSAARQRTTEYQPHDVQPPSDEGVYSALAQLERGQAASKLTELLHWSRAAPEEVGQPTSLSDCLRGATPAARRTLIAAYWHAREQAARYQVLSEQSEQLGALSAVVIGARDTPGMAEAGVRAQAMRRSARAALLDAQAALVDSQFMLTQVAGRPLERPWLFPETPPQAHHGAAAPAAGSRPTHTPAARFLELQEARVDELAHAVIQADAGRATLVAEAHNSSTPPADQPVVLDLIVQAVGSQTEHTLAFLRSLTDYNLAVAEHVLVTLPANTPGDELARQLAPERGAPDKS